MKVINNRNLLFVFIPMLFFIMSCAAGNEQFTQQQPAGFWYGIWHGMISVITLIIHIFKDTVSVYEINNTGGWYDFGFLLGVICVWGGSSHASTKSRCTKGQDKEWDDIAEKIESKVMRKLTEWAESDEESVGDEEWEEIGEKVEKKLKQKIREWAEKD